MRDNLPSTSTTASRLKLLAETISTKLTSRFDVQVVLNISQALQALAVGQPAIVYCSSHFVPSKIVRLLDAIKEQSTTRLIPVILGLDLTQPIVVIPGTRWAGKLGILTDEMSVDEIDALLNRLIDST